MRLAYLNTRLPAADRPTIMGARMGVAFFAVLCCASQSASAQEHSSKGDDLDVTMQIIVDPDAKLPDEVVRKIPLPTRSSASAAPGAKGATKSAEAAAKGQSRAEAARELDHGISERAKERAQDAAQQREQAGRTIAEDHRRDPPHPDPPARPQTPPGRP